MEGIARADPLDYEPCAGVEERGELLLLVPIIVTKGGRQSFTDDLRDCGGYIEHDPPIADRHKQSACARYLVASDSDYPQDRYA